MNSLYFLLAGSALALPQPSDVQTNMTAAAKYFIGIPGNKPNALNSDCGWTRGAFMSGFMKYHAAVLDAGAKAEALAWANTWANAHNWTCGGLWQDPNNIACGMAYTDLYDIAPADYKLSLAVTLDHSVTRWVGYDWWWVDTLFMGLASMIKYANRTGDVRFLDTAFQEYKETTYGGSNITSQPGLWDPASNLYWRDHTFIKSRNTDGSKVFWARGNGWAAGAMALSLEALEGQTTTSSPAKAEFTLRLQHLAQGLAGAQGSDGLWRANLLDQSNPPNPESTGSNFFTFAMAYGVRTGILDRATYLPVVEKAWVGLSTISLQPNGLVGWCQPVGGSPEPATQLDTSDFCVGGFLLAASEVYKLATGQ